MTTWAGIDQLYLSPQRPRGPLPDVPASLQRLVDGHGPLDPIVVRARGPRYKILSNTETWLAAQRAGWREGPIDIRDDITDADAAAILALTSGVGRSDPIEEARQLAAQLDRLCAQGGWRRHGAITRLSYLLGKSRPHMSHMLRLLNLPVRIQELVSSHRLSLGHARALVALKGVRRQHRLAERIIREKLSVRETEAATQGRPIRRPRGARSLVVDSGVSEDPDVRRRETILTDTLGSTTRIDTEAGHLIIHYAGNLDLLQGLIERLGCNDA